MSRVTAILIAVTVALVFGLMYYHGQVTRLQRDVSDITQIANSRQSAIDTMLIQRQQVAAIDIKYTKELADAKSENERLRADIANGSKWLQLNASCTKPVSKTTGPASVPDDASARLTNAAERDYLSLRERIGIATTQIAGLQSYIRTQCQ
ncbi:endopeptidase [Yersinia ruckeri]|uniref:lysis protein n=1 Tax=Yersinia ruckeri TaxID=29486 RepID=UPI0008FE2B5D|nr:lysis protein [Yersinia ruckeri]OJB84513.1 endopeptidase [Yersinia ruckeri]